MVQKNIETAEGIHKAVCVRDDIERCRKKQHTGILEMISNRELESVSTIKIRKANTTRWRGKKGRSYFKKPYSLRSRRSESAAKKNKRRIGATALERMPFMGQGGEGLIGRDPKGNSSGRQVFFFLRGQHRARSPRREWGDTIS